MHYCFHMQVEEMEALSQERDQMVSRLMELDTAGQELENQFAEKCACLEEALAAKEELEKALEKMHRDHEVQEHNETQLWLIWASSEGINIRS